MKQDSWLYSDSFLKRAFAIYGYNLVAGLIIAIGIWFVIGAIFVVGLLIAGSLGFSDSMTSSDEPAPEYMEEEYNEDWLDLEESL